MKLLFVAALVSSLLGKLAASARRQIAERKDWFAHYNCWEYETCDRHLAIAGSKGRGPSIFRVWLGDEPRERIIVAPYADRDQLAIAHSLFPEADIYDARWSFSCKKVSIPFDPRTMTPPSSSY